MPALCDSVFTYVVSTLVPSFLVSVWILVPSGLVVVSTLPELLEPPEEEPPEDWA